MMDLIEMIFGVLEFCSDVSWSRRHRIQSLNELLFVTSFVWVFFGIGYFVNTHTQKYDSRILLIVWIVESVVLVAAILMKIAIRIRSKKQSKSEE